MLNCGCIFSSCISYGAILLTRNCQIGPLGLYHTEIDFKNLNTKSQIVKIGKQIFRTNSKNWYENIHKKILPVFALRFYTKIDPNLNWQKIGSKVLNDQKVSIKNTAKNQLQKILLKT